MMRTKRGASAIGALSTTGYRIVRDHGDSLIHPFSTESLSICCAVPDTAIGLGVQEDRQKSLLNPCRASLSGRRATPLQCYVTCSQAGLRRKTRQRKETHSTVSGNSKVGGAIGLEPDRSGFRPPLPPLLGLEPRFFRM